MEIFDVIIVGAGPGGLRCAEILAESKLKVLLLEQNKVIGPKVCAGGIFQKAVDYLNLPKELIEHKYREWKLHTPLTKTSIKHTHYIIERERLGQWQLSKLKKTDVVVKTNSRVTKIEKNKIIVNNKKTFGYKYLVGADGSSSIVRRHLSIKTEKMGVGIQYIIPTKKYKDIKIFQDTKLFDVWYAWIFPHKNYVSIGTAGDPKFLKNLNTNFNKWLKMKNIDISKAEYQAHPINTDFRGYKFGNIFLVGDAAGLASILTGEGIYPALVSGEEIAKIIIDKRYISKKMGELIKTNKIHHTLVNIALRMGPFKKAVIELLALMTKNKWFAKFWYKHIIDRK